MRSSQEAADAAAQHREKLAAVSTLAGLTPREHLVFFSLAWSKANGRLPNVTALGRQLGCTRQAVAKSLENAVQKLSVTLGHDVDLPEFDGVPRAADLVITASSRSGLFAVIAEGEHGPRTGRELATDHPNSLDEEPPDRYRDPLDACPERYRDDDDDDSTPV
jgi:hypothetical protein